MGGRGSHRLLTLFRSWFFYQHSTLDEQLRAARSAAVDVQSAMAEALAVQREAQKRAAHWRAELQAMQKAHAAMMRDVPELVVDAVREAAARGCGTSQSAAAALADDEEDNEADGAERRQRPAARRRATRRVADDDDDDNDNDANDNDDDNDDKNENVDAVEGGDATSKVSAEAAAGDELPQGPLPLAKRAALAKLRKKDLMRQLALLEEKLNGMKPNMAAIAKWHAKQSELNERRGELDAVTERRDAARRDFDALRKRRLDEFMVRHTHDCLRSDALTHDARRPALA